MIERNDPIDFVGEVAILAGKPRTSVTLETTTECTVLYFSRKDFEDWISKDIHFLRLVSQKVAYKLYRSSYNRGSRLFYPPRHLREDAEPDYPKTEGGGACGNHQGEGVHDQGAAGDGQGISEERVDRSCPQTASRTQMWASAFSSQQPGKGQISLSLS